MRTVIKDLEIRNGRLHFSVENDDGMVDWVDVSPEDQADLVRLLDPRSTA